LRRGRVRRMNTWGISGPDFLVDYALLTAVVLIAVLVWRRAYTGGPSVAVELTATQLAFLNGGRQLAVYSSIAALRAAGAIEGEGGRVRAVGPLPVPALELDRAVHNAAAGNPSQVEIEGDRRVQEILDRVEAGLLADGWLLTSAQRSLVRRGSLAMLAVLVLGAFRLAAGLSAGKPVGYLILMMLGVLVLVLGLRAVGVKSRAARRVLATRRSEARHLAPSQHPAWSTYGPSGAALGVGLFGASALWAADPAFAEAAAIQGRYPGTGGGGDGGGGCGGGGCGGGGCGGGGCGG
jgi:uncharacterized protein (TIGR04222 family)